MRESECSRGFICLHVRTPDPHHTTHSIHRAAHTRLASRSLDRTLDKVVRNKGKKEITLVGAEDVTRLARLLTDRIAHAAAAAD